MCSCLCALTRKKCPGDRFSPSHRSKAKPPSRGPAESTELGHRADPTLVQDRGTAPTPAARSMGTAVPWCTKRTMPLSICACVKLRSAVLGAERSTTLPLAGGWMEKVTSAAGLSSSSARRVWGPMVAAVPSRSWGTGEAVTGWTPQQRRVPCTGRHISAVQELLVHCWVMHASPGLYPSPHCPTPVPQHVHGAQCPGLLPPHTCSLTLCDGFLVPGAQPKACRGWRQAGGSNAPRS